ncbi:MAG: phage tail assembly protein [Shimia sp.]|nr:phage tail assembly protein [Shimia sp.]
MPKIAKEVAEQEFERFIGAMDIDLVNGMDEEDTAAVEKHRARIVGAIESGQMIINDEGEPVMAVGDDAYTFHEPRGADLQAQDSKKNGQDFGKLFAILASITNTSPKAFSKMRSRDLNTCTAVMTLMLG